MADLKFEILDSLGVLSEGSKGWQKEINVVSWNGRKGKIDIRDWDEEHKRMGKGVTLTETELIKLKEILQAIDLDSIKTE